MERRFSAPERWPTSRGTRWIAVAGSLAVHLGLLLSWRLQLPVLSDVGSAPNALPSAIQFVLEPTRPRPSRPLRVVPPRAEAPRPESIAPGDPVAAPADTTSRPAATIVEASPAQTKALRHDFGDGRLWVQPMTSEQLGLTHRLTRGYAQIADSAVKATIQAYLDSMAIELAHEKAPSWVGEVGGRKFGVDSRFVYIAGLKIPALLLGLLPLPAGGNQQMAFDRSGRMFEDLRRAATRSANYEEFKEAVKALRQQSEFEHHLREVQQEGNGPEEGPVAGSSP